VTVQPRETLKQTPDHHSSLGRRRCGQFETVCGLIICVAAVVAPCGPHGLRPCRHGSPTTRQQTLGSYAPGACA
jgi:hypothetical protein